MLGCPEVPQENIRVLEDARGDVGVAQGCPGVTQGILG